MSINKKVHPIVKSKLHPRNKNKERYDLKALVQSSPELEAFVALNKYGDESIEFSNPEAVKALNKAILKHHYKIDFWDIPEGYLCPPIPGRADYIHHIADVLCGSNYGKIPTGSKIKCLDIGVGANCIYPIIGQEEYGWSFIASDIDPVAIESAEDIVENNPKLKEQVDCRLQHNVKDYFYSVIAKDELFDLSICNPPFHSSAEDAQSKSLRKLNNLNKKKVDKVVLNFGGQSNELWCDGGEERFVTNMIKQSKKFAKNGFWFSSLISKESILNSIMKILDEVGAEEIKTIPMGQGNKISRVVAWTFLSKAEQKEWKESRWKE